MKRVIRVGKGKANLKGSAPKKTAAKSRKEKTTLVNGKEMVSVQIDHKTVIFVPKGSNKEKVKQDFIEKWKRDQGAIYLLKEPG